MKCKNCGALLHENDTFCRTCAAPVDESCIEDSINLATSDFAKTNQPNSHTEIVDSIIDTSNSNNNNYYTNRKDINNKDLLDKDPNNKVKATIINIGGLILMLFIILILIILFIKVVSNL